MGTAYANLTAYWSAVVFGNPIFRLTFPRPQTKRGMWIYRCVGLAIVGALVMLAVDRCGDTEIVLTKTNKKK
jgi:hypothetical protein